MKRIAILWHERQRRRPMTYLVNHFAAFWREDGHEVVDLFGPEQEVAADLILVHVDLSIVPDDYLAFARRYPIALNAELRDVRKSVFSRLRVARGDGWRGRVIVKSELNYAGLPERWLRAESAAKNSFTRGLRSPADYRVYDDPGQVPDERWSDPEIIVERFVPEMEDGLYASRSIVFLGDRATGARMLGPHPIVNSLTMTRVDRIDADPRVLALCASLKFDYGKFDYLLHDGDVILIDANKTVGGSKMPQSPERTAIRRERSKGIYYYFRRGP